MKTIEIVYRYNLADVSGRPRPANAEEARQRLDVGGRTIRALVERATDGTGTTRRVIPLDARDIGFAAIGKEAPKQRPFAAILGCSDARVPIELIFNEGPNDLFVVRVAGNGLGSEVLGSLKYAVDHLGGSLRLIVVLGHSGCGAISAAVDVFLDPQIYLTFADKHALRNIIDRLLVVVHASAQRMQTVFGADVVRRPGYREALIEMTIVSNAALTAHTVQEEMRDAPQGVRTAYGTYLIASHEIWAPRADDNECRGLAYPPAGPGAFGRFAAAVVGSQRIAALLERGAEREALDVAGISPPKPA